MTSGVVPLLHRPGARLGVRWALAGLVAATGVLSAYLTVAASIAHVLSRAVVLANAPPLPSPLIEALGILSGVCALIMAGGIGLRLRWVRIALLAWAAVTVARLVCLSLFLGSAWSHPVARLALVDALTLAGGLAALAYAARTRAHHPT